MVSCAAALDWLANIWNSTGIVPAPAAGPIDKAGTIAKFFESIGPETFESGTVRRCGAWRSSAKLSTRPSIREDSCCCRVGRGSGRSSLSRRRWCGWPERGRPGCRRRPVRQRRKSQDSRPVPHRRALRRWRSDTGSRPEVCLRRQGTGWRSAGSLCHRSGRWPGRSRGKRWRRDRRDRDRGRWRCQRMRGTIRRGCWLVLR